MSVGKKSDDGKRFLKSKEITDDFIASPACDKLITSLFENAENAVEFIAGIMPVDESNMDKLEAAKKEAIQKIQEKKAELNVQN